MADYIDTIRIGDNPNNEKPIWDTAITVNGAPFDNGTHNITIPTDVKPTSESPRLLSSGTLFNLLKNTSASAEYSVTLPTADGDGTTTGNNPGWKNNSVTVTVADSIITSNSVVIVSPSPTSSSNISNYGKFSIYCSSSNDNGSLTFSRFSGAPSGETFPQISVNVLVMNIRTSF